MRFYCYSLLLFLHGCSATSQPLFETLPAVCPALMPVGQPASALEFGRRELATAMGALGSAACVQVVTASDPTAAMIIRAGVATVDPRPESFVIVSVDESTWVIGSDENGAMYGAYELAERMRLDGLDLLPLQSPIAGAPASSIRAANIFVTMPTADEGQWWFLEGDFWEQYLDMLARARMNFLDLHGMYNLANTVFPNALLYFGTSASHPEVGIAREDRARNVAMLETITEMARVRGIKVGLMSYRADVSLTGEREDWDLDQRSQTRYTREAVADIARRVPNLARLGFRIGESQRDTQWYVDSFVAGLHDANTGVKPYTRTWQISKHELLKLLGATDDKYIIEAKLNGEQMGAPYAIAGGALNQNGWDVYSYQDYLNPPEPYEFVFQVRTGGTHRIFRYASYERTRRIVASFALGSASGFSVEPPHAFYPQRDFYHHARDQFSDWTFRRDEMFYYLFGRLSYEPRTSERVFRYALQMRVGTDALWDVMQASSEIVPWIQVANTCGPDARDFAPELELGGSVADWARPVGHVGNCNVHGPFDTFAIAAPSEVAQDLASGRVTTRVTPMEVSRVVLADADRARSLVAAAASAGDINMENAEARDIVRETHALADLGSYFGHKLRAATALAIYDSSGDRDYLDYARAETVHSSAAFTDMVMDTAYIKPFEELLRMNNIGIRYFHWSLELPLLARDSKAVDDPPAIARVDAPRPLPAPVAFLERPRPEPPSLSTFKIDPPNPSAAAWTVTAEFAAPLPSGSKVRVLWKQFSGLSDWQSVPTSGNGRSFSATIRGGGGGALFAVEGVSEHAGFRLPDMTRETPYYTLAPMK